MRNYSRNIGNLIFKGYLNESFDAVEELLEKDERARIVDLGCADGTFTLTCSKKIGTKKIYGIEVFRDEVKKANKNGIKCIKSDLNNPLPFSRNYFDVVISHYSIEHLVNINGFVSECFRILKPGGYIIVASDNLNSWLNIFAMIFSFQPFSLTRGLADKTVGNPFAYWTDSETGDLDKREKRSVIGAGSHIKVMSTRAAVEVFRFNGFTNLVIRGAGYFPLFGVISRIFAKFDVYHSHFYIIKARKPK